MFICLLLLLLLFQFLHIMKIALDLCRELYLVGLRGNNFFDIGEFCNMTKKMFVCIVWEVMIKWLWFHIFLTQNLCIMFSSFTLPQRKHLLSRSISNYSTRSSSNSCNHLTTDGNSCYPRHKPFGAYYASLRGSNTLAISSNSHTSSPTANNRPDYRWSPSFFARWSAVDYML